MDKLHVAWMYPDLLNLHGERGSVQALRRVGENLGLSLEILRIEEPEDPIPFEDLDLMLFLPGEIRLFPMLREAMERQRGALEDYLRRNGYLIAIGTTGLLFGKSITREDGSTLEGLGLLDMTARERQYVWGDDLHLRLRDSKQELFGAQVQMADVEAAEPLADTLYGYGNNGAGTEGARYKNLIYTGCLGPLFVKNPWWAEAILRDIAMDKYLGLRRKEADRLASDAFDAGLRYLKVKPKYKKK